MRSILLALALTSASPHMAPAFTHRAAADWINSPPLTLQALSGKVVLVEFWTFACSNCVGSLPWVNATYGKYEPRGLQIIGVHTPELAHERVVANVKRKVTEYDIRFPVMIDGDFSYWDALSNQVLARVLLDRQARPAACYVFR